MDPTAAIGLATVTVSVLTIGAILSAPIIALRVQRQADEAREKRSRKLWIFKTLMSSRATRLNPNFVQALNMIDIEFTDAAETPVRHSWKELLDHYTAWGAKTEAQRKLEDKADVERSNDLLANMLSVMGRGLGYEFDKVYIKKGFYYPEGLGNLEAEAHAIRRSVLNLLAGNAKLPVAVFAQDFKPLSSDSSSNGAPPAGLELPV